MDLNYNLLRCELYTLNKEKSSLKYLDFWVKTFLIISLFLQFPIEEVYHNLAIERIVCYFGGSSGRGFLKT